MENADFTEEEFMLPERSQKYSDTLVDIENIAMNAIKGQYKDKNGKFPISGRPDKNMATELLHSNEYHQAKINIITPINQFYEELDFSLWLQLFIFTLTIIAIFLLMFGFQHHYKELIDILNQRVNKRTNGLNRSNLELSKALDEIKTLKGIITICSYCDNIRDDEGVWVRLEKYLSKNSDARFSHGICKKCIPKVLSEAGLTEAPRT